MPARRGRRAATTVPGPVSRPIHWSASAKIVSIDVTVSINFELLDLRAFLAVFDLGTFHKAAELLNLSQPALSRRIQGFEARLGIHLLERSMRHAAATRRTKTRADRTPHVG